MPVRPLIQKSGVINEATNADILVLGQVQNVSKEVDGAGLLASKTVTARRTYLTGTVGVAMAITLPAASASIDGLIMTVCSTATRVLTSWTSAGASTVNLPGLSAMIPVSVQYDHATLRWYAC